MPATLRLTPELAAELVKAVEVGVPIETASQAAGISEKTFYEWLQAGQRGTWTDGSPTLPDTRARLLDFSQQIRAAQARFEAKHIELIAEAAQSVNEKTGIREWRAGSWLLNNHPRTRERYRQHRELEVKNMGTIVHEHQLASGLDPQVLEQAYDALALPPAPEANEP